MQDFTHNKDCNIIKPAHHWNNLCTNYCHNNNNMHSMTTEISVAQPDWYWETMQWYKTTTADYQLQNASAVQYIRHSNSQSVAYRGFQKCRNHQRNKPSYVLLVVHVKIQQNDGGYQICFNCKRGHYGPTDRRNITTAKYTEETINKHKCRAQQMFQEGSTAHQ